MIAQATREAEEEIKQELGVSNDTDPKRFLDYKYVIVADGNAAPSSRLALQLFGNSLVFLQETPWFEGFYRGLRPFVHYVPVSLSFIDLPEKVTWAQAHQEQVKQMIENARNFAESFLTHKEALKAFSRILLRYSNLLQDVWSEVGPSFLEVPVPTAECANLLDIF